MTLLELADLYDDMAMRSVRAAQDVAGFTIEGEQSRDRLNACAADRFTIAAALRARAAQESE